jgi:competence protein ComEC
MAGLGYWLLQRQKSGLWWAALCLLLFAGLHSHSIIQTGRQQKLIVYNVPRHQAVDVMDGHHSFFIGDAEVERDQSLYHFHLAPSRIQHRVKPSQKMFQKAFDLNGKKVMVLDSTVHFKNNHRPVVDVLILSKNPRLYMHQLQQSFRLGQVVIDASVPPWKAALWQKDCDSLQINCYNVAQKGAFVMQW